MRLVIEAEDFRRLSPETQRELIRRFAGRDLVAAREASVRPAPDVKRPIDLGRDLAAQLLHGLSENHRKRLALFARAGGRVRMRELLAATGDRDPRVLSYFQSVITRKLRRIIGDRDKRTFLIGWDFDATVWNRDHTRIVDGVYYVSPASARTLGAWFEA